ncbi:hypothetical protein NLI96_g3173 [Meripilus lineatus]|uniref:Uncharacterized protein n=1 Tax=Meripilus lineatus TaxID=2056292 RepID=A0AAD5V767_9APHY|nr:hypothetical protein NLI96_g3173 [Physisporinus lineatus]
MGGFVIETFLGILLYGISLAQAYVYWLNCTRGPNYNHDPRILRSSVLLVMIIETVHTALLMQATYHHTVITACSPWEDLKVLWSAGVCVLLGTMLAFLRAGKPSHVCQITANSRKDKAFGVGTAAFIFIFEVWTDLRLRLAPKVVLESGITLSAATDLTIAGILIYRLRKSRTGFEE